MLKKYLLSPPGEVFLSFQVVPHTQVWLWSGLAGLRAPCLRPFNLGNTRCMGNSPGTLADLYLRFAGQGASYAILGPKRMQSRRCAPREKKVRFQFGYRNAGIDWQTRPGRLVGQRTRGFCRLSATLGVVFAASDSSSVPENAS